MLNSPVQPDRHRLHAARSWKRWPTWSSTRGLAVLSDEIYEQLVFGDARATCFATLRPGLPERTITDQRRQQELRHDRLAHGLGAGADARHQGDGQRPEPADQQPVQHQPVRGPGGPGRRSGVRRDDAPRVRGPARPGLPALADAARRALADRRTGAFYAFFNVAAHFGRTLGGQKVTDSASFCQAALESAHVNLVPGAAFGAEGYVRLSFATSREQINGGLDRLEQLLK